MEDAQLELVLKRIDKRLQGLEEGLQLEKRIGKLEMSISRLEKARGLK